jgi:signal peptide peptidase SppA
MLSNLLRRNPSKALISDMSAKFRQPMLMHPIYGTDTASAYLDAAQFFNGQFEDSGGISYQISDSIAVLDIAGALVARDMASLSAFGMTSYEAIKSEVNDLLNDPAVDTIIGRFDSPGGMAAQNLDLSDFIYASRGQGTKFVAMVDDMAYSAAYAIASAFDEIWVTRTGGVGSVGVVSYHVNQSKLDERMGVSIEYIYAGDKKIIGNPHEPLGEDGREQYQNEVNRLYTMFTSTVARNIGLSVDAVKATEAGTFHGEDAVTVGFAHTVGTFDELLASLGWKGTNDEELEMSDTTLNIVAPVIEMDAPVISSEGTPLAEVADAEAPVTELQEEQAEAEVVEEQPEAEVLVEPVVDPTVQQEQEAQVMKHKMAVEAMCVSAGVPEAAEKFVGSGMELSEVRDTLLALTSNNDSAIITSASASQPELGSTVEAGWAKAFAKAQKY